MTKIRALIFLGIFAFSLGYGPVRAMPLCSQVLTKNRTAPVLSEKVGAKYNTPTVVSYRFTAQGLEHVKALYHQLPVPQIVENIISGKDQSSSLLMSEAPDYFAWNQAHDSFMTVNPTYTKASTVVAALKSGQVGELKDTPEGIALITWYVHPHLLEQAQEGNPHGPQKILDLERGHDRYLVSILDLEPRHLAYLKDLRKMAKDYLTSRFGVTDQDQVRLDFHFPYAIETSTLHLHARVNAASHPLELSKSYPIDDIIRYLESGRSVQQLILDRQEADGQFYFSPDARQTLQSLGGGAVVELANPFLSHP